MARVAQGFFVVNIDRCHARPPGAQSVNFAEVEPEKPYLHALSVQPDRAGVFYLSVVVTTQIGNSNLSRTFSIPFAVGNVPAQQKPAPQTDASGEAVQPAKARETMRPE